MGSGSTREGSDRQPVSIGHNQKRNCGTKDGEIVSWARVLTVTMGYFCGRGEEVSLAEEVGSWAVVEACLVLAVDARQVIVPQFSHV